MTYVSVYCSVLTLSTFWYKPEMHLKITTKYQKLMIIDLVSVLVPDLSQETRRGS